MLIRKKLYKILYPNCATLPEQQLYKVRNKKILICIMGRSIEDDDRIYASTLLFCKRLILKTCLVVVRPKL